MIAQQLAMDEFINEYNYERPHEALGNLKPSNIYTKSLIDYPSRLPELQYDTGMIVKKVKHNGEIQIKSKNYYVGSVLTGESVAVKDINDTLYLYFGHLRIGSLDQKNTAAQITDKIIDQLIQSDQAKVVEREFYNDLNNENFLTSDVDFIEGVTFSKTKSINFLIYTLSQPIKLKLSSLTIYLIIKY